MYKEGIDSVNKRKKEIACIKVQEIGHRIMNPQKIIWNDYREQIQKESQQKDKAIINQTTPLGQSIGYKKNPK